jgi:hypothetical protein
MKQHLHATIGPALRTLVLAALAILPAVLAACNNGSGSSY